MKGIIRFTLVALFCVKAAFGEPAVTPELLDRLLKRFPEADTNKDGKLTEEEARISLLPVTPAA